MIQELVADATAHGLSERRAGQVLGLTPRTLQRWRQPAPTQPVEPRPRPVNALTRSEAAAVVSLIRSPQHADQSCRELALSLSLGIPAIPVSHLTVWRYQVALACNGPRGRQRRAHSLGAPDTDWVTSPNQLWDYDVTWLTTLERYVFLYLYSLLDHFSRKVVAWLVRETFTSEHLQTLWDHGLVNEGLLDRPRDHWPQSLCDRGAQMRAYSTRQYFEKLGIAQLFSRPRQPNDNPRIEAHFGTVKTHPAYPGRFADQPEALTYFSQFYPWYNTVHPLTTLQMLTPQQLHSGQTATLLASRTTQHTLALAVRRDACHAPFTLEELIAKPLPDVSDYPVYSWAGPTPAPAK
ncbi:MAG: DDE-type integrase/transposase/recombinase [Chloroflexota bacterium]